MAQLPEPFDANTVAPSTGTPPSLPTDWYNVIITESETALTKKGKGLDGAPPTEEWLVRLVMKVMDGPYVGRLCYDNLNLGNANPVAHEIAQGTLSAICHAVNVFQVQDTQVLHGIPLMVKYVEKGPKDGYDAGNEVKGYAKIGEKQSSNGNNIRLEPIYGDKPPIPAAPGPAAGAPNFDPPWKTEVAPVAAAVPAPAVPAPAAVAPPPAPVPAVPVAATPAAVVVAPPEPAAVVPPAPAVVVPPQVTGAPAPVTVPPSPAVPAAPEVPVDPNTPPWKT